MDAVVKVFWFHFIALIPGAVLCLSFKSIETTYGENVFQCNMDYQLVCQTESRPVSIVIRINGTQAAYCLNANCNENRDILGEYTVSNDTSVGILRLHIHKVSIADASNIFTCEGDSTSKSIQPVIKVVPEKSSTKLIINESNSTDVIDIQALTGCVLLRSNLTFVWKKTRYSNGTFLEPLSDKDFISISPVSEEFNNCIASDHCGGTARSNTLIFREETIGGTYYFITCTIVIDKNDTGSFTQTYTVISERSFAFKGSPADPGEKKKLQMGLGLGLGVGLLAIAATCFIVFLIKDPVFDVKVLSRKIVGNTMTITLQWKSRLYKMKTFYVMLNNQTHSTLWKFTKCEDGVFEHELSQLDLNSTYSAYVYSTMWKIPSCRKRIDFDTNASPLPPCNFCEEKALRTPSSITLKWNRVAGPKHHFVIKYQRTKGRSREWMFTEKINDTRYTVDGLKPGRSYTVVVQTENVYGVSEESQPLVVKTRALKPVTPEDFRCISVLENEVTLSWKPYKNIHKQTFILTVTNIMDMSEELHEIQISIPYTGKHVLAYTLTGLKASSKYMFELFASAGKLLSESSAIAYAETTEACKVDG